MKKIIALFLAVSVLSGCVPHTELDKLAIAEVIGIDKDANGYTVTIQYFNTDTSGSVTAVDSSSPNAFTAKGSGRTIESAFEAASYTSGKEVMLGAAEMIVFGRDAAVSLRDSLSFTVSHYSGNPSCYVAAADGKAEDILNVKFSEGNASADKLEGMLTNSEVLGLNRPMKVYEVMGMLCESSRSTVLPLLRAYNDGSDSTESGNNIVITGSAVIADDSLAGELDVSDMSGVMLVNGRNGVCRMTLRCKGEDVCVMLYGINTRVIPSLADGRLSLELHTTADCKYVSTSLDDPYNARDEVEELCAAEIRRRIAGALSECLGNYGADVFGLDYKIRSFSPEMWEEISGDYREFLKNAEYDVTAEVNIERFGITHNVS